MARCYCPKFVPAILDATVAQLLRKCRFYAKSQPDAKTKDAPRLDEIGGAIDENRTLFRQGSSFFFGTIVDTQWITASQQIGGNPYQAGAMLAVPAIRKDGSRISVEFTIVPFRDDAGQMVGNRGGHTRRHRARTIRNLQRKARELGFHLTPAIPSAVVS
jgi:hypothetical protein